LEHDKGTLRVSGGRKAYRSWQAPTWLGFRWASILPHQTSPTVLCWRPHPYLCPLVLCPTTLQRNGRPTWNQAQQPWLWKLL